MELSGKNGPMNIQKLKEAIDKLKTTTNRFKIPLKSEELSKLLDSAMRKEVESRNMVFEQSDAIDRHLMQIADWATGDTKKPWLIICGKCGNGKTTMMKAFAFVVDRLWVEERIYGVTRRMRVKVTTAKDLAAVCVKGYDEFKKFISVPMLAVDDVGIEPSTLKDYGTELTPVADMIAYRYEHGLFTMITTNIAPPDIAPRYGERTADRLREMAEIVAFKNDSYRRNANNIQRKEVRQC